jgi:hypothetical protein
MAGRKESAPRADLRTLDPIVGTWRLSGGAQGVIRYEWAEGGFFLMQHVDLEYGGRKIKGVEIIGHLQRVGENASADIHSRFYSFLDGLTLDYVYEIAGETWTIWFGPRGSDNRFVAKLSADGKSYRGAWQWTGGGYEVVGARIK